MSRQENPAKPRVARDIFIANVMIEVGLTVEKVLVDGPQEIFIDRCTGRTFHTDQISRVKSERNHMHVGTVYCTYDTRIDASNYALLRDGCSREGAILSAWEAYEARECGRPLSCAPEMTDTAKGCRRRDR